LTFLFVAFSFSRRFLDAWALLYHRSISARRLGTENKGLADLDGSGPAQTAFYVGGTVHGVGSSYHASHQDFIAFELFRFNSRHKGSIQNQQLFVFRILDGYAH
jgi:hypothetical protein